MGKKLNLNAVLEIIRMMSQDDKDIIVNEIMEMMGKADSNVAALPATCETIVAEVRPSRPNCPYCGARAEFGFIVKDGKKRGRQQYLCKACKKKFQVTTGTLFAGAKKPADTWRKFIELTIDGYSIAACAKECGICVQTSFNWRHKLLHVFEEELKSTNMSGTVEVDEMLIPLSYKGNHVQGVFGTRKKTPEAVNDMPRDSYKRGTDNVSLSPKDKACVFCMVQDGNKGFYASVPGVGFMTKPMLNITLAKHVDKDKTMMLADNYKVTKLYLEENGYSHTILASNTSDNPKDHKPEVKDGLHLQHVNAMHHHIRKFLAPYCGVSSKYLSHYVALFVWLKNIQSIKRKKTVEKVSIARAATPGCYIPALQIHSRPAIPACA